MAKSKTNPPITVREVSRHLLDDYFGLFEGEAFKDNPDWATCYCMYYDFPGTRKEWQDATGPGNRKHRSLLIAGGGAHGFLAYLDGKPVAWCNAAPRAAYPAIRRIQRLSDDDSDIGIGSIVCFVVAPSHRGKGIASSLLQAACEKFSKQGLTVAEAYPSRESESAADNFPGPLSMYLQAGFKPHRETEHTIVVRKQLSPSAKKETRVL